MKKLIWAQNSYSISFVWEALYIYIKVRYKHKPYYYVQLESILPDKKHIRLTKLTVQTRSFVCHYWQWPILINRVMCFVCSKMADETNLSSKLPVADRTREVWGRKLCWWCLSSGFPLCTFLLGFADPFCFVFTSSPSYEASPFCTILCNMFPWLLVCWSL